MVKFSLKFRLSVYDLTAVFIGIVYSLVMSYISLEKFHNLRYGSLDLGIFTQSLSSTLHGRFLYNTVEAQLYGVGSHFGVHFQPVLLFILPLFALHPSAETLLIIQSAALGLSVLLAYLLAREYLSEDRALLTAFLYAFNSSLIGINAFEFHPVSIAVPLFLLAALFMRRGNMRAFYLTSALILTAKEDAFLGVLGLSLWGALGRGLSRNSLRKNRSLLVMAIVSTVYGIIAVGFLIPHFGSGYLYGSLYDRPSLGRRKLLYFALFNASFAFLLLFKGRNAALLALPWFENLLASRKSQTMFGFHYPYVLVPLSFLATLEVVKEVDWRRVAIPLIVSGLLTSFATMPLTVKPPTEPDPLVHPSVLSPLPGKSASWEAIALAMGLRGPIYTQPEFYPAMATQTDVYLYPKGIEPRVIVVNLGTYHGRRALRRLARAGVDLSRYRTVFKKNEVVLMVRP